MSWLAVAHKDFLDAGRSKALWVLSVLFIVFAAGLAYLYSVVLSGGPGASGDLTAIGLITFLLPPILVLVPISALLVGYKAVAGERESGTLKLLLALPHTRLDVVVGKLVGRTAVLAVPVVVGFAVAAVVVVVMYASFDPLIYAEFLLLTVAFGAVFVSIAVAISSATGSTGKAAAAVFAAFVLFQFLWRFVPFGLYYLFNGTFVLLGTPPNWFLFVRRLAPGNAYRDAMLALLPDQQSQAAAAIGGDVPFYLADWFALVVLAAWIVVPVGLGYWAFERADL